MSSLEEYKASGLTASGVSGENQTAAEHTHKKKEDTVEGTLKQRLNICQWLSLGIFVLIFWFLFGFLIFQWSTWDKKRINRYG